jgi:DNA-binding protein, YbaB/EbfC family
MPDFSKMLQQAQAMKSRVEQMQEDLRLKTVTGTAGAGMVTVDADGKGQVTRVRIDRSLVDPNDIASLEDLVVVAVNDAQNKAADLAKIEMGKVTGGLDLPFKLPF